MSEKPGYQTTEFWVTILTLIGGFVLLFIGKDEVGSVLVAAAGVGYPVSRGLAKQGSSEPPT